MNNFNTQGIVIVSVCALLFVVSFCSNSGTNNSINIQVTNTASEGLDLNAVGDLLIKCKTAEELEKRINSSGEGINNLDLDEDGKVDYLKVTEFGEGSMRGISLTTELASGQEQEVATIEVEKKGEEVDVQTRGNEQIYGHGHYSHSHFSFGNYLMLSYLFGRHPFYVSPWHYGYYPSYYSPYRSVGYGSYRTRMSSRSSSSKFSRSKSSKITSKVSSPNKGKAASNIKAPLKNPSKTQKSFQARNPSKQVKSGGFGRTRSKPSVRSSSYSRGGSFSRGK